VTAVLAAPTVGATQTAELLAERLDHLGVIESAHWLLPGVPAHVAAAEVVQRDGLVVLVGDEPGLSELAAALIGKPTFPPHLPSQASLVEGRRGRWSLRPDTLERVDLVLE
jgi:phosphohistidine phosphatase SixA